jgi:hypothetical protein
MNHSEHLRGKIILLEHRLRDLSDWVGKVPIPKDWSISSTTLDELDHPELRLNLFFPQYDRALAWGWTFTKCHSSLNGWEARQEFQHEDMGYLSVPMIDFIIVLSFPFHTKP